MCEREGERVEKRERRGERDRGRVERVVRIEREGERGAISPLCLCL